MEYLRKAIDALNAAQLQCYAMEKEYRWVMAVWCECRNEDPTMFEIKQRLAAGARAMAACQTGIAKAISNFEAHRLGLPAG